MHYGGKPYIADDNTETDQLADYFKLAEKMINEIDADGDAISIFTELLSVTDYKEQEQQKARRRRGRKTKEAKIVFLIPDVRFYYGFTYTGISKNSETIYALSRYAQRKSAPRRGLQTQAIPGAQRKRAPRRSLQPRAIPGAQRNKETKKQETKKQ